MQTIDFAVLVVYLLAVVGFGCWFVRRSKTSEHFMAAGRSLPGWAVGLSIFGSYVSSITFLANPGKAYQDNWNPWVFALSLPLATWLSVRYFVPFYRRSGQISAYEHLERRFGQWARTYAVVCYLLTQLTRLGMILYLLALALQPIVGLDIRILIVAIGILVIIYPLFGGTEAVIWTGVIQSVVMSAGPLVCLGLLLARMPEGPGQILSIAGAEHKFSLGSLGPSLGLSTVWVVLAYGLVMNLQNFGIDQTYVQRYITAKSDQAARRSVWMGGLLYIPISGLFLFIGTALFAFYRAQPHLLPADIKPDAVFPHFIGTQLPTGLTGLVLAAVCSAAMDSNLNCCATLLLCDIYRRYFRPAASEREAMWVLRLSTLGMGILSTVVALAMIGARSALDQWWQWAGVFGGGMLGLFLLGLMSRRATNLGALAGAIIGVLTIAWMTVSPAWTEAYWMTVLARCAAVLRMTLSPTWAAGLARLRSPFHGFLTIVAGTVVILVVGWLVSQVRNWRTGSTDPPSAP